MALIAILLVAVSFCQLEILALIPKIVGGSGARIADYPYQVAIVHPINTWGVRTYSQFCGGSILSQEWILTAAHCVIGKSSYNIFVAAGTDDVSYGFRKGTVVATGDMYIHPDYDEDKNINDIALIRLKTKLNFNKDVQPIKLPKPDQEFEGRAIATGFGKTSNDRFSINDRLMVAKMDILPDARCKKEYSFLWFFSIYNPKYAICAGQFNGQQISTCDGDSGGPLAKDGMVVGVTSYGSSQGCGMPHVPVVFSKVSKYVNWINSLMEKYSTGNSNDLFY